MNSSSVYLARRRLGPAIYTQASPTTISNTAAETTLFNSVASRGTRIIPANYWKAGKILHFNIKSLLSTTSSAPNGTLKIKLGGTTIFSGTETLPQNLTDMINLSDASIMCKAAGASGRVSIAGSVTTQTAVGLAAPALRRIYEADVAIDTTQGMEIDLTYQFSAASTGNKLIIVGMSIEWR